MYNYPLIVYIGFFSLILGILISLLSVWIIFKAKKKNEEEKKFLFNLNPIFSQLPQPYIKVKFETDEKGEVCNFIVLDINSQFENEFGVTKNETIGKSSLELGRI